MAYYLHHYFDPEFNHQKLRPREGADGSTDARYLGYVQNVVKGQVLAELVDMNHVPRHLAGVLPDRRYISDKPALPAGPNCGPHPDNENLIIALANGYCFYHNGLICVKRLLNVRNKVGFHTGNIFFVNDLAVHGDVQTGFSLQARNILIKGHMESVKVKARGDLVCLGGVTGANLRGFEPETGAAPPDDEETGLPSGLISARGSMRLAFCGHTQLRARKDIIIDGSCSHSTLYAGGNLVIKGRLHGGAVYAGKLVYVQEQLGSSLPGTTRVHLGSNPFLVLALQKADSQVRYLEGKVDYFRRRCAKNEVMDQECRPRLELASRQLDIIRRNRETLLADLELETPEPRMCRVVVPGTIMPGSEIVIAGASLKVTEEMRNKVFRLKNGHIFVDENRKVLMDRVPDGPDRHHLMREYADDAEDTDD